MNDYYFENVHDIGTFYFSAMSANNGDSPEKPFLTTKEPEIQSSKPEHLIESYTGFVGDEQKSGNAVIVDAIGITDDFERPYEAGNVINITNRYSQHLPRTPGKIDRQDELDNFSISSQGKPFYSYHYLYVFIFLLVLCTQTID